MNNFLLRCITSVVFVAIMVCGLLFSPVFYGALFLVIMLISLQEFFRMTLGSRLQFEQTLTLVSAAALFCLTHAHFNYGMNALYIVLSLIPMMMIPFSSLSINSEREDFGTIAYLYCAFVYIAVPLTLSNYIAFKSIGQFNGMLLLCLFLVLWSCDAGAYCVGTLLGQKPDSKKLAPKISPKKSWWGFWGGVFFGVAVAVVVYFLGWLQLSLIQSVVFGLLISASCVIGDLFESKWKRYFGIKDSGNCIPGHGGMLDRFDSSLLVIPIVTFYLIILTTV